MDDNKITFRNPKGSKRYIRGIFLEEAMDKSTALYTLKEHDYQGLPSLYLLYILEADPTEYRFANKYLDGWSHWERLCQAEWFKPFIEAWRRELEIKIRSDALAQILVVAKDTANPTSYHANKYLLDGSWKPADKRRGRPSKDEVRSEITRLAASKAQIDDDAERIGLQ